MAKFSLNPFKWFRRKTRPAASSSSASSAVIKPPVKPRKSGNVFMHLITLQKSLQSMDLALGQEIDFTWLVQKGAGQVSLLKLEAETVGEEELAEVAGQVSAYFETVSEGRLDLDKEGMAIIHDFVHIFKDAIGDAAPGISSLDRGQLETWNARYQSLMARMKPIYEDAGLFESAETGADEQDFVEEEPSRAAFTTPAFETNDAVEEDRTVPFDGTTAESLDAVLDGAIDAQASTDFPAPEDFTPVYDVEDTGRPGEREAIEGPDMAETSSDDELPSYDPVTEGHVRDVVIPDAEIRSAREYMELGETKPGLSLPQDETTEPDFEKAATGKGEIPTNGKDDDESFRSSVQLEEVERLKEKLLELHEKQEILSSKMSGILGDFKKAVKDESENGEPVSVEELGVEELEDIIFIGRRKG